ncbi:hypothetical protein [Rubinisphaera sp.]|uniref:hypothetical protein n=1 Tax=Rubinisphaera sp. TaxID=2024857 RepID=UPI000C0FF670|nr:hypothetical protein [Rubinisphaera sp.]MBV11716.1 hypothetical protein [Rubinisphaera sp.]HCS50689.1 hypothetical protein [Planctomycetaceae bacterium]|tara:strand:+ start:104 stop:403 length:300 start_codon:yes stop_codon:yes gene_type:complete
MNTDNIHALGEQPHKKAWLALLCHWLLILCVVVAVYAISSGPVMGIGFWLRETTGHNEFYAVMLPYYPLFALKLTPLGFAFEWYVEWWVCDVFQTVGPG